MQNGRNNMPKIERFFVEEERVSPRRADLLPPAKKPLPTKTRSVKGLNCEACGLYSSCQSPKMDPHGQGGMEILFMAEAPGPEEDKQDDQLVGEAGQLLRRDLNRVGLDLEEDGHRINSIACYPGHNSRGEFNSPTNRQIACCRQVKVLPAIQELKPKFIVLMGNPALQSFWGEDHSNLTITKFRGRVFPDKKTRAWVFPIFHPSYILRNRQNPNLEALWMRDLKRLAYCVKTWPSPEFPDPALQVEIVKDFDRVVEVLENVIDQAYRIVLDYETSGLKPYAPGHKILSVSMVPYFLEDSEEDRVSYSFPLQYPEAWSQLQLGKIIDLWVRILESSNIKKAAHNLQFEDLWSRVILDTLIVGWEWCTMNNQHIIDNTTGITGLKWQAWERWGVWGYDSEFKKYAMGILTKQQREAGEKHISTHAFNRVHQMPLDTLLMYGGCDGILESWLLDEQLEEIKPGTGTGHRAFSFP